MMKHSRLRPLLSLSLSILVLTTLLEQSIALITSPEEDEVEASDWEDVHSYRRRIGQHFDYQPQLLSPEVCRHTTEEHCQQMDEHFTELATANRRHLQAGPTTFKVLVLLVQFADHTDRTLIERDIIERMWNADGTDNDYYPTGSIKTYFEKNSYGRLSIEATVVDWQTIAEPEAFYGNGNSGLPTSAGPARIVEGVFPILDSLDADASFDFGQFDNDQRNSNIDVTVLMHSGYAAERGNNEACNQFDSSMRIQSFAQGYNAGTWRSSRTGIEFGAFVTSSVFRGNCNFNIARMGVTVHEMVHTFGIPDLYDLSGALNTGSVGGIGGYDTMANAGGQSGRQAYPGFLSPWTKMKLGWLTPIEITVDGTYVASPSETTEIVYMIAAPYASGEYLLIENRQPIEYDLFIRDWGVPNGETFGGGILIYHIDDEVNGWLGTPANGYQRPPGNGNHFRGYPGQDGWPGNLNHYQVALLQADGLYEQEQALNNGHYVDFWREGSSLGPGNGELVATAQGTYPNTDSYSHNRGLRVTGLTINNFQLAAEGIWQFDVNGLSAAVPVTDPPTTSAPTSNPTLNPTRATPQPSASPITAAPTEPPTFTPTSLPTRIPTSPPTFEPTVTPLFPTTRRPTSPPTDGPTLEPSNSPTASPTTNSTEGCCSRDYRDCDALPSCSTTQEACENCEEDPTVLWLARGAEEVTDCVPRFGPCDSVPADCCGPVGALSCSLEAGNASSTSDADRRCFADADLIQSRSPSASPAPSDLLPSSAPSATPTGPTAAPTSGPSLAPDTENPSALPTAIPVTAAPITAEPTPGATQKAEKDDDDSLSRGAKAGIALGALVGVICCCYLCAVVLLRQRGDDDYDDENEQLHSDGSKLLDEEEGAIVPPPFKDKPNSDNNHSPETMEHSNSDEDGDHRAVKDPDGEISQEEEYEYASDEDGEDKVDEAVVDSHEEDVNFGDDDDDDNDSFQDEYDKMKQYAK